MGLFGKLFGGADVSIIDSEYAIDSEFIEAAKELIDETLPTPNAVWKSIPNDTVANPAKPWQVSPTVGIDYPAKIIFYPSNYKSEQTSQLMPDTDQTSGMVKGIMYRNGFDPTTKDAVIFKDQVLKVTAIKEYRILSEVIIYEMELSI